ncbi:hypothetical protein IAT40_005424 [Kwoniella sp. CBS 6097]
MEVSQTHGESSQAESIAVEHEGGSDYGDDFDNLYDDELEKAMQEVEFQSQVHTISLVPSTTSAVSTDALQTVEHKVIDIEDVVSSASTAEKREGDISTRPIEDGQSEQEPEVRLSPFAQFRKKGFLSVSDLVGPIWCETQYDYKLRTLPFLPPEKRPDVIKSAAGTEIVVNKVKVEGKERILRRGEKIHKRLEREIHPEEVKVQANTREDAWGLRFLNMFSAVEALLTLGKCREMPVVGFLNDTMIMGIIDEIVREPIDPDPTPNTRSSTSSTQTSLVSFFSPVKSRAGVNDTQEAASRKKTHRLYISDSKTRTSNTVPRDEDAVAGKLQVMMYKEMLDAILIPVPTPSSASDLQAAVPPASSSQQASSSASPLPSRNRFSWERVFTHVNLDPRASFSEGFVDQSRAVVLGNGLRHGAGEARTLNQMRTVWEKYVIDLGLGTPTSSGSGTSKSSGTRMMSGIRKGKGKEKEKEEDRNLGRTEERLELVYRRAEGKKKVKKEGESRRSKRRRKGTRSKDTEHTEVLEQAEGMATPADVSESGEPPPSFGSANNGLQVMAGGTGTVADEEERLLQLAISESLKTQAVPISVVTTPSADRSTSPPLFMPAESPQPLLLSESDTNANADREELTVSRPSTRASERLLWGEHDSSDDREDEEFAREVERSLGPDLERERDEARIAGEEGEPVTVNTTLSQQSGQPGSSPVDFTPSFDGSASGNVVQQSTRSTETPGNGNSSTSKTGSGLKSGSGSGSIIGRKTFRHSPLLLAAHLESVLGFWMGIREPTGVTLEQTNRCGMCEFEEGCEWRAKKAEEIWKSRQKQSRD